MQDKRFSIRVVDEIKKSADRLKDEMAMRLGPPILTSGIRYVDDVTGGIGREDFFLLGAKTGIGKTEAAKNCALQNALVGKSVHFFALEAAENEIERRIKYTLLAPIVYGSLQEKLNGRRFNYQDWIYGAFDDIVRPFENELNDIAAEAYPGLHTYYSGSSNLSEENIEETVLGIQDQTDLIIIDHLHYFSFNDQDENWAMKKLIKSLKMLSSTAKTPILLVAHLRKSDKRMKQIIPDVEDFHGSSDVAKIATHAILLSTCSEPPPRPLVYPTYVSVGKNRLDQSRTRYAGVCFYDVKENKYEEKYHIGKQNFSGDSFEYCERQQDIPYWATHARPLLVDSVSSMAAKSLRGVPRPRKDLGD